jgi:hypothetical protein
MKTKVKHGDFELAQAGFREGDIVVIDDASHNKKRVVNCSRLKCMALQNGDSEKGEAFSDLTAAELGYFSGSIECTFTLPPTFKGKIRVVDFQPVRRSVPTCPLI